MIENVFKSFFHRFGYKIAAIFLALLIWAIVQGQEIHELNKRIFVNLEIPEGYAIEGLPYRYLNASLKGPKVLLAHYLHSQLRAKIEVPTDKLGKLELLFDPRTIENLDSRIQLNLRNNYINLIIGEKVDRRVPVKELIVGTPAEGFFVKNIVIKPTRIKVSGIKSEVYRLKELTTQTIDIKGISQSKSFTVPLSPKDGIKYKTEDVEVRVQLGDSKINKIFYDIPISVEGNKYVSKATPNSVSIKIQGTPGVLSFIKPEGLKAFVEMSDVKPGVYEKEIKVQIPSDTVLIETTPSKCSVEVTNLEESE